MYCKLSKKTHIMEKKTTEKEKDYAQRNYPGAETDNADDNKVDKRLVEQETRILNNNPRH